MGGSHSNHHILFGSSRLSAQPLPVLHQQTGNYNQLLCSKAPSQGQVGPDLAIWQSRAMVWLAIGVWSPNRSRCLDEQDRGGGDANTAFVVGMLTSPAIAGVKSGLEFI